VLSEQQNSGSDQSYRLLLDKLRFRPHLPAELIHRIVEPFKE
jgi:hypothetical protein